MSPVSLGDVVAALRLINWIRSTCIDPGNNAQVRYLEFKREIDNFENRLVEYRDAFHQALGLVNDDSSRLLEAASRHEALKQEADTVIGDFLKTLTDCEVLLKAHVKYDSQRGTVLDNIFWHSSTQAEVEDLRRRIQAHSDQISLLVGPVRLQLATDTAAKTHYILDILMAQVGLSKTVELPKIPSSLDVRFRDALSRHTTIQVKLPSQIPLEEGVYLMTRHYRKSTAMSNGSVSKPTVEEYLHLLKAHWLVETLLKSDALKQTQPGHVYRRIIKQVQQSIAEHYEREEVLPYTEDELCALSTSNFDIWPPKVITPEPPLTESNGREEMLANRLPVVSQSSNEKREISIFRMDNGNLRIDYECSSDDQTQLIRKTETSFFDLNSDRLVPLYTIATGPRTEWSIQMFYGNGASQANYPLQTRSDAFKFQRAFIGYETAAYSEGVLCAATYKKSLISRDGQHVSNGEIQLLQWPIPNSSPSFSGLPPSNRTSSSMRSGSSYTKASWTFRDANPILTSVSELKSVKEVVVTALPPSPLIIAFTQDTSTYIFWQIERKREKSHQKASILTHQVDHIELERSNPGARHLGFREENDKPFPAHMLTIKKSELKSWDLCAFFSALKGSPKEKKSKDKENRERPKVKTLEYTHLALAFKNDHAKEEFEIDLLTQRQKQLNDVAYARSVAESDAQSPTLAIHSETASLHRSPSLTTRLKNRSRVSVAPKLPPIPRQPTLSLDSCQKTVSSY